MTFLKKDPTPCVMLKQVFLDCFELVVAHFGPPFAKAEHKNTAQNLGLQYNVSPRPAMPAIEC